MRRSTVVVYCVMHGSDGRLALWRPFCRETHPTKRGPQDHHGCLRNIHDPKDPTSPPFQNQPPASAECNVSCHVLYFVHAAGRNYLSNGARSRIALKFTVPILAIKKWREGSMCSHFDGKSKALTQILYTSLFNGGGSVVFTPKVNNNWRTGGPSGNELLPAGSLNPSLHKTWAQTHAIKGVFHPAFIHLMCSRPEVVV